MDRTQDLVTAWILFSISLILLGSLILLSLWINRKMKGLLMFGIAVTWVSLTLVVFWTIKAPASLLCIGQNACCDDAINLCGANLSSDRDAIGACLYQHRAGLSAQCKENMKAWDPGKKPAQSKGKGKPSAADRP